MVILKYKKGFVCLSSPLKFRCIAIRQFIASSKLKIEPSTNYIEASAKGNKKGKSASSKKESLVKISLTKKDFLIVGNIINGSQQNKLGAENTKQLKVLTHKKSPIATEMDPTTSFQNSLDEFNAAFGIINPEKLEEIQVSKDNQIGTEDSNIRIDPILSSSLNTASIDLSTEEKEHNKNSTTSPNIPKSISKMFPRNRGVNKTLLDPNSSNVTFGQSFLEPIAPDSKTYMLNTSPQHASQSLKLESISKQEHVRIKSREKLKSTVPSSISNHAMTYAQRNGTNGLLSFVPKEVGNSSTEYLPYENNVDEENSISYDNCLVNSTETLTDTTSLNGSAPSGEDLPSGKSQPSIEVSLHEVASLDLYKRSDRNVNARSENCIPNSLNVSLTNDVPNKSGGLTNLENKAFSRPPISSQLPSEPFANGKGKPPFTFPNPSFEQTEAKIVKSFTFTFPANSNLVINLLHFYDQNLDINHSRNFKISIFFKTLRLLFYLYRPSIFTASTIFNISKLKVISDASTHVSDISLVFPLERMLPTVKAFQESKAQIPVDVHISVMSILDKVKARLFAYEYYLEFIMRDFALSSNPNLLKTVIKALSSHQFASRSIFEHFIRNGGVPTPNLIVELLSLPYLIDSSYLYEAYYDQFIRLPYLEQRVNTKNDNQKIENNHLLLASQSMLRMYAHGSISNPSFFQKKIDALKIWIGIYAPVVGSRSEFLATCRDLAKEKSLVDTSVTLD